jgi:hypothetical protein
LNLVGFVPRSLSRQWGVENYSLRQRKLKLVVRGKEKLKHTER